MTPLIFGLIVIGIIIWALVMNGRKIDDALRHQVIMDLHVQMENETRKKKWVRLKTQMAVSKIRPARTLPARSRRATILKP